jgi:hypothetical protein
MKISKILVFFFVLIQSVFAQESLNHSPLSSTAPFGEILTNNTSAMNSMGGLGIGTPYKYDVNLANPASYALLDFVQLSADMSGRLLFLSDKQGNSDFKQSYSLGQVSLGFSYKKRWGMRLGFMPMSTAGYSFANKVNDATPHTNSILGKDGVNQFILGQSVSIINKNNNYLSVGFDFAYYFGGVTQEKRIVYDDIFIYNTKAIQSQKWSDFNFKFGAFWQKQVPNKDVHVSLGVVYGLGKDMRVYKDALITNYFINAQSVEKDLDTVYQASNLKEKIYLPHYFGGGFGVVVKQKIRFGMDFVYQPWSSYTDSDNTKLKNYWNVKLGLGFNPSAGNFVGEKFLKTLDYRLGVNMGQTYFAQAGQVMEYSANIGMGIPLLVRYVQARLNLSLEYLRRQSPVLQENYLNMRLGFSLGSPYYEKWFEQRKFN